MERLFLPVQQAMQSTGPAAERLTAMIKAHAMAMMRNAAFEAVVVQGVHMHRLAATTPDQRKTLDELIAIRRRFEGLFKQTLEEGIADGSIRALDISITAKAILGAVNWLSIWYRPMEGETEAAREAIADKNVANQTDGFRKT